MKKFFTVVMVAIIIITSMTFTNNAFATSIPTTIITSVKAKDKAFTVKWKKKSDITGYQIQYSTNKKFKKNSKKIQIKQAKTTSKKITGLKSSKKYYVRIRTYKLVKKKKSYSSWSKKKCIIVENSHCTNNNNHSIKCGNIGRWFNSRSDIETYWKNQCNALAEKWDKGEISDSEYYSKSPYGYECWSCSYCGKWTGNFKYR